MNTQFDNMIQVLTYFANQCDMFRPMLEGVESLQQENMHLRNELEKSLIVQNRMQLNATFAADYANFGITVAALSETEKEPTYIESEKDDLYNLFKSVICVGKHNYDKTDMQYRLDFYSMIDKIDFDKYVELLDLIDSQHMEDKIDTNKPEEQSDVTTKNVSKKARSKKQ